MRGKRRKKDACEEDYQNCAKLYGGKPCVEAAFEAVCVPYQERKQASSRIEVCRLCGRNAVHLYNRWGVDFSLHTRMETLLEEDVSEWEVKFVNHILKFNVEIVKEAYVVNNGSTEFVVSPLVYFEDVAYFFLGKELKRSCGAQVACSWASIIGYWLSSNAVGTVVHLWNVLPPKVLATWQVVDAPMDAQICPQRVREVRVWDAVASYKGALQKTGMLRKFMKRVPNTHCRMCRMSLFPEEVHGVPICGRGNLHN